MKTNFDKWFQRQMFGDAAFWEYIVRISTVEFQTAIYFVAVQFMSV